MDKTGMSEEYISLVYLHARSLTVDLSIFSRENGFLLQKTCDRIAVLDQDLAQNPDLVLIETDGPVQAQDASGLRPNFKNGLMSNPVVFLVLPFLPDTSTRLHLLNQGVNDFLILPLNVAEIQKKYALYQRCEQMQQKKAVYEKQIKKQRAYLDTFKQELKKTKSELLEERTALNTALKQLNQMDAERARLKKERKKIQHILSDNIQGFFEMLCQLIELRVEKERGHARRVAQIALFIAKQFRFDEKQLEDLRKAALLHETGLLLIPQNILEKTDGSLTSFEQDLFAQHPVKGAALLARCSAFENAAQIVRGFHENADGSGYPDGLKRRSIPVSSRILAGADLFDALRQQMGAAKREDFFDRLETFSGSRLDPVIVSWLEKYAVAHMDTQAYPVRGIGIHQLEPGMTLGTAVYTHTGTKLFSVNTLLTIEAIDKIKKYNREYPVDETVYIRA